jgi:hypothetical protein
MLIVDLRMTSNGKAQIVVIRWSRNAPLTKRIC